MSHYCWVKCLKINPSIKKVRKYYYMWGNTTSIWQLLQATTPKNLKHGEKSYGLGDGRGLAERKFLLLPCLSRGFAMGKQLKGPSHLTLNEKREILDKTKSMKYWKRISSALDAKPINRYHNTGLCPRLWPPDFHITIFWRSP